MKNHLKRIASPKSWKISRQEKVFTVRPKPGPHSLQMGLPLGLVMRDFLDLTKTMKEAKKVLNSKEILVDGRRRKDYRFIVGLFDVLSIPEIKKNYRVSLDKNGRLTINEINEHERNIKVCKIVGKSIVSGGKVQLQLHDGKNVFTEKPAKIGDSVVITMPEFKIKEILHLKEGAFVFLTKGKNCGKAGILKEVKGESAVYSTEEGDVDTKKSNLFVLGSGKEPLFKVN